MWFKNLQVYRFTKPFHLNAEQLDEQLAQQAFQPCGSQDLNRTGWVPPLGRHGSQFVHTTNGYMMICSKRQEKILPASVIKEIVEEKALEIEENESRHVARKERLSIKEDVIFSLLPRAFVRSTLEFAYIAPADGLLVVNLSSAKRAEEFLHNLREAVDTLSLIPITPNNIPIDVMTGWVEKSSPATDFELGEECELRDNSDTSSIIRCKNQNLESTEINNHIKAGMHVAKLGLIWQDRIECLVDEKLAIKRLRFSDIVQDQANEVEAEDAAEQFDLDFSVMTLELSAFIKALTKAFGGEDQTRLGGMQQPAGSVEEKQVVPELVA